MGLILLLVIAAACWVTVAVAATVTGVTRPRRKTYAVALARRDPTDPAELGLRGEEQVFRLSDGVESPGWLVEGDGPAGLGVCVVHGFQDSRFGALRWAPHVTPHAGAVAVYDQRAHGDAGGDRYHHGEREADDLRAVLGQSGAARGVTRWVVFGLSAGAGIALLAAEQDACVVGVVADGPYRRWDGPLRRIMRHRGYPTWPTLGLAGWWLKRHGLDTAGFDRAAVAARVEVPLLVLAGGKDVLCPAEGAREIAEAAPGGEFVLFEGAAHLALAASDPERYASALRGFFESLSAEGVTDGG